MTTSKLSMLRARSILFTLLYVVKLSKAAEVYPKPTTTPQSAGALLKEGLENNVPDDIRAAALMPDFERTINRRHRVSDQIGLKLTALQQAIYGMHDGGDPGVVSALLEVGADATVLDPLGYNVLDLCALHGRADVCRVFIEYGVDPNRAPEHEDGRTPLHRAVLMNHLDVAQVLVELGGANVDVHLCMKGDFERGLNSDECFHPVYATDGVGMRMLLLEHAKNFVLEEVKYHSAFR